MAKHLETWVDNLATKLREDIPSIEIAAGDKLVGNVIEMLITIDGAYCEIIAVRSKRKHAHVAVFAETEAAAQRLAELLGFAYRGVSRFANAERKFVHRIERVAKSLVRGWANQLDKFPAEPLARIAEAFGGDARAMIGRGYHVDVAGDANDKDHEKHRYDPFYAVSVPAGSRRRAMIWDPVKQQFVIPATLASQLDANTVAAAGLVVADNQNQSVLGDIALEATSEVCCALPDFLMWLPDLGDCVPDCGSFDLPDCDIGGCDL